MQIEEIKGFLSDMVTPPAGIPWEIDMYLVIFTAVQFEAFYLSVLGSIFWNSRRLCMLMNLLFFIIQNYDLLFIALFLCSSLVKYPVLYHHSADQYFLFFSVISLIYILCKWNYIDIWITMVWLGIMRYIIVSYKFNYLS